MRRTWKVSGLFLIALMLLASALAACGNDGETAGTPSVDTNPGLHKQADGTVQVVGILAYRDAENGFWAVVDTDTADKADDADVLAVLGSNDQVLLPVKSYEGKYVSVTGVARDEPAYKAGPFVEVKSIEILADAAAK